MQQTSVDARRTVPVVEEVVSTVLAGAATGRHPNPHSIGIVRSNSCALNTRDTTSTVPDFFPVGSVAWPDTLLSLWKTVRYSSLIGVFAALSRAWFTVDNKLVLWDYQGGREFCVYDEIPELITVIGTPVRPVAGAFQPHVTYVLPVATTNMLFLLGLCVVGEDDAAEMKVVSLGYSCSTDVVITKISGFSGRVFCAGADGHVYEVRYMRENTPFTPKIRLVSYTNWFSSTPVVGQLTSVVSNVWETWTGGAHGGLIDLAVDERDGILVTLSEQSTIGLWRINSSGGLRYMLSLRHQPDRQLRSQSTAQGEAAPLIRVFVIDADAQGCRLMATALNGDQFRYRYTNTFDSVYSAELILQSHTPSYLPPGKEVSVCYGSATAVLVAFSDASDDRASDEVLAATSPPTIMAPHHNARDIVTVFSGPSSHIVRVDAIDKLPSRAAQNLNDLCAQTCSPAVTYIVVHRHGLSLYTQARPVDTLYLILSSAGAECRDALLSRFTSVYSATDYAAMLFQIAIGALHTVSDVPRSFSGDGSLVSSGDEGLSLSELGRRLRAAENVEAQRKARDLLRSMQLPGAQSASNAGVDMEVQQIVVLMSPFATGLATFLARSLSLLWDVAVSKVSQSYVAPVAVVLTKLIQYLDSLSVGSVTEQQRTIDMQHEWQQDKVVVFVPRGRSLRSDDVKRLQATMLYGCYELAHKALQATTLLQRVPWIPLHSGDAPVTFAQVMRDAEVAQRLGRYLSQVLLDSQQGVSASAGDRVASFIQLQQKCPYFFGGISTQAYRLRSEMDALTRGESLQSYTESQVLQWAAEVGAKAALFWPSGALQSICEQLRSLKRENVAVELLLHAAAQLDPNNAALHIFLSEGNGQSSAQLRNSSAYAVHQTKTQVLELAVSTMEAAWLNHRSVVDDLLGGPRRSGTIWQIEPSDEYAHCFLFDWLCAPRHDKATARALRETLLASRSPFLASYLRRNAGVLTEEYAHYLSHVQGDYKGAMQQCFVMAQSPLPDVPVADRLPYRIRCLREALECAKKCQSDQRQQVEQQLGLLETQQRLYRIATSFVSSGDPSLDRRVQWEGQVVTERDVALQQIDFLSSYVASASDLIEMGGMYPALGGAEVQLDALLCSNVTDPAVYATCIGRAFQNRHDATESITKRLIEKYFNQTSCFPLSYLVRILESRCFLRTPTGSPETVQLLVSLGVDPKVLFLTYETVLGDKDDTGVECEEFEQAGVTTGYLVYGYATVLLCLADLARRGSVQQWLITNAMAAVRNAIRQAASNVRSSNEQVAVEGAEELLAKVNNVMAGGMPYY
ncbi:putative nuclear pore complex protein [Leptomonas pyrrhocoris]|uniref:Putative nuclear pore complex protein n=1 Tax=Leptomonas pyrrhocoris TaxID=157538 RepID=A0A0N0DWQ3_LEPPY|nr:putative nuclear pore complex protein [Leptomonas pyrrhocoris]XP_015660342.1 putative nuclear pore complex protein [Leptomonas pyrrhocoris]KPA81902.1 putative nuclear pore complex protein [Leptomonas pyrrhocoris]KPA81903.1 putative nuclear pore complex protein [Leptomonas pyrrhocoris]|eukprot:XP_015660341.1 putative nuclear pore complex protein [Leptomonas pyrrhocoris]